MKRLLFTLTLVVLIIIAFAFAAEKPSLQDTKPEGVKTAKAKAASSKEIKLNATGKVMEVSETNLKIERNVKGKDGALRSWNSFWRNRRKWK